MSVFGRTTVLGAMLCAAIGCKGSSSGGGSASPPRANAGTDLSVWKGDLVALDGRASSDPAGRPLAFQWRQTAGPTVALSDDRAAQPSFVAPRASGALGFALQVSAGEDVSTSDDMVVAVQNRAPRADAGPDVVAVVGNVATVSAARSWDPDGDPLTATWFQRSGPSVSLVARPDGAVSFVAPGTPCVLELGLVVTDGEATSPASPVRVQVVDESANWPPVASAGADRVVPWRSVVLVTGFATDRENDPLTFTWIQRSGPAVALLGAESPTVSFVAPDADADVELELVVADGLSTTTDRVMVSVRNQPPAIGSLWISPAAPITTDALLASAMVLDPDQDPVTWTWEWRRNGVLLAGETGSTIAASLTTRGDVFTVRLVATDGAHATSAEATVTIQDAPPVLTMSVPATAPWGQPLTFQVSGIDPDGDPVGDVVLLHGPAGMTLSPAGAGAWTPTLPMFDRALAVHLAAGVAGSPELRAEAVIQVVDPTRAYPLRRSGIEIPFRNGLVAIDLDGDGTQELLVAGRTGLYELAHVGSGYAQRWMYPFALGAGGVAAVEARDVDGDGAPEIFLSDSGSYGYGATAGTLVRLEGATRREAARADRACVDLEAADIDRDGAIELVCLTAAAGYGALQKVVVLDAATLAVRWETPELGLGGSLALGNVDLDPALEIVTSGGYVFDGATGASDWAYGGGFGMAVDTGDLDGDGVEEIVGMDDWSRFRGFSAVLRSPLWEKATFDNDALLVADVDGDGRSEILVGDGQWGNVTAWRWSGGTADLETVFQIGSQDHGVTAIAVGDLDGDGALEIAWGTGASSSGEDVFVVAGRNPAIGVEWKNVNPSQLDGPFLGAAPARTVAGAAPGLLFLVPETDSGYAGSRLVRLDPATGAVAMSPEIGSNWSRTGALDVVDYDGDGVDEAFLATANLYTGSLVAYDFAAGSAAWTSPADVGNGRAIVHADLNGDGAPDLVALTYDGFVHVFDVLHSTLLWKSTSLGGAANVAVADVDGDGLQEIVALSSNRLFVFHKAASGPVPWLEAASVAVTGVDLAVADCDGDGTPEPYVLTGTSVERFDGSLARRGSFAVRGSAQALFVEDLGFPRKNLVLAKGSAYSYPYTETVPSLEAVDAATGARIWESPPLWGTVSVNSLRYVDLDADGHREIAFGTSGGMYLTR